MKRTRMMLTDDEVDLIRESRDSVRWAKGIQRHADKRREVMENRVYCQYDNCIYEVKHDGKWCGNHRPGRHRWVDRMREIRSLKSATLVTQGSIRITDTPKYDEFEGA